jgi:methylenetetrahydrofolate reductase (NADH)
VDVPRTAPALEPARFEILPLGRSEEQAAQLPEPVRLTVTCSPKHGPDHSVAVAARLRALGHAVTVHIAARMVRDREHLDRLLAAIADAGADDLFLIGGDADPQLGAYASAVELAPLIDDHPRRPRLLGIAGYPEGHPLISDALLAEALALKSPHADYLATQMCFDAGALRRWIERARERGIELPVMLGMPGDVSPHKLLELSVRIGVGPSLKFLRKQRGLRNLISRRSTADRLYEVVAPMLEDPELHVAGIHFFTFNQLLGTWQWQHDKQDRGSGRSLTPAGAAIYVHPEERSA